MERNNVNLNQDNSLVICRIKSCLIEKIKYIDEEISKLEVEISKKRYSLNYYQNLKNKIEKDREIMKKYIEELESEINVLR
ncbi:MAG: hypothetical protein JHC29_06445 [Thermoplasmata archaeon]|jgi:hypothetical protein|nr:hypothetical protein [Thermoplasmata archaeon]